MGSSEVGRRFSSDPEMNPDDLRRSEMVEEAVLGAVISAPSRLKRWMKVETRMYPHPIVDRILYATR
jgi:hypothetical protein